MVNHPSGSHQQSSRAAEYYYYYYYYCCCCRRCYLNVLGYSKPRHLYLPTAGRIRATGTTEAEFLQLLKVETNRRGLATCGSGPRVRSATTSASHYAMQLQPLHASTEVPLTTTPNISRCCRWHSPTLRNGNRGRNCAENYNKYIFLYFTKSW